jgi:riboflavin synthase
VFTGLIQHVGVIANVEQRAHGQALSIDPKGWSHKASMGDSLAISGCCLTRVPGPDGLMCFDVIPQTLAMTVLGQLHVGDRVNLEAAMLATSRLDGHVVQGHVDAVGEVTQVRAEGAGARLRVALPDAPLQCCVEQGSIAIDGVSLTIAGLGVGWLDVALIPATMQDTTLGTARVGDQVNIETDVLARHVAALVTKLVAKGLVDQRPRRSSSH